VICKDARFQNCFEGMGTACAADHLNTMNGVAMRDHGRQTYNRIVENASYGLREKGAEGLGVVDLMKLAGLTHGGFYNHFDSRAALVGEAIAFAMDQTTERWKELTNDKANGKRFEALIADYLRVCPKSSVSGIATILNSVAHFQLSLPMSLDRARACSRHWLPNWRR